MEPTTRRRIFFRTKAKDRILFIVGGATLVLAVLYYLTFAAPWGYPQHTLMKVPQGSTLSQVAQNLRSRGLIHSAFVFKVISVLLDGGRSVVAGEYYFDTQQNVFTLARRLSHGEFDVLPVRITIPEGASVKDITQLLKAKLPDFDALLFYSLALPKEGTLFPDTYFFLPGEDADLVLQSFENNFDTHMRDVSLALHITEFGKPLSEVLTMASLLEKEAGDTQNRRIISGILWKRIQIGMPLQVDAVFLYILGKNTFDLSRKDLATDSLYNSYTHKGLPPGPITNPGLDAILAAVTPITTKYLYYLSDRKGNLYYATTYEQHLANRYKYLGH